MRSCIGKRRSNQRARVIGLAALTCLSIILTSCSSFNKTKDATDKESLESLRKSFCKSSSGRGRAKLTDETNRFTFQSELGKQSFSIGIDIPFKGQETLIFDFKDQRVHGSLYQKMSKALVKHKRYAQLKELNGFLKRVAIFFASVQGVGKCKSGECLNGKFSRAEDGSLYYLESLSDYADFHVDFERLTGHFSKVSISATKKKKEDSLMRLDMIVDSCQ